MRVRSERVNAFLAELLDLGRKHGLSLAHEDTQGAFEVHDLDQELIDWLLDASDKTTDGEAMKEAGRKAGVIFVRCDECRQLFGAERPTLPPEPGEPDGYLGEPGKVLNALKVGDDVIERHEGLAGEPPLWNKKIICPPCRASAEERGGRAVA